MSPISSVPIVIVNPTAGRGQAGKAVRAIRERLGTAASDWIWRYTKAPGDDEIFAREAAAAGASLVVAVGGDGTIHGVANGIIGSDTALGIVPVGTGNDLARALSLHGNPDRSCRTLLTGVDRRIDVGVIEGSGMDAPRHFLVLSGTGYDARTAKTVNEGLRWMSGAAAYVAGAILTLREFQPFDLTIETENERVETRAMFASFMNTANTGGGMRLAPDAKPDDGLLDICLVREVGKATLLYQLTQVFSGRHVRHPAVSIVRASRITVSAIPPQPLLIDGEVDGTTPAKIGILPAALKVRLPAGEASEER